ncbi:MAG TPA: hypothetical protein VH518_05110 [Tepidisphaeraceae bacterium]
MPRRRNPRKSPNGVATIAPTSRLLLFSVPIGDRDFRVMLCPEPLPKKARVDFDDDVIWIDPSAPIRERACLIAHAVSAAWKRC